MENLSYKARMLIHFGLLFVMFAFLMTVFQFRREDELRREQLNYYLRAYANIIDEGVHEGDSVLLDSAGFQELMRLLPSRCRLTIIDGMGKVRYESDPLDVSQMENHLNRTEVRLAYQVAEGNDIRLSRTDNVKYFYFAKRYDLEGLHTPGDGDDYVVRIAMPYDDSLAHFFKPDHSFMLFVLMVFATGMIGIFYVTDHYSKSIMQLRAFLDDIDRGVTNYNNVSFPKSELGLLCTRVVGKYRKLDELSRLVTIRRDRLLRHFHYSREGIALFTSDFENFYVNARFLQYVNVLLESPTPDINEIWNSEVFEPIAQFARLNADANTTVSEAPVFSLSKQVGGSFFEIRVIVYANGDFEVGIADVTIAEREKISRQETSNNILHELRTPISCIRGYLETLLNNDSLGESNPKRQRFVEKAYTQTLRLTNLISDVALVSKTDEAPELVQRTEVDVVKAVDDVYEDLRPRMEDAGMKFFKNLPDKLVIHGNYTLIYSIFRNLIENSINYAGKDVEFHVDCYNIAENFAYFSVYDTGQGVPEENLQHLFERFYRVNKGRSRENGGSGLGLSIVYNAVSVHHGGISVRNREGGGLEFLFTLRIS